jgi:hypothetical protein
MRRLLVLSCVTAMLGALLAVAPAIVRPDANRAEAGVACDNGGVFEGQQVVARHDIWYAMVVLCVERLGSGIRPGVMVWCGNGAGTQFPCNWDFNPLHLHNQSHTVIRSERAYATGKTGGDYIATPHWSNRSQCYEAYSDSPQLRVRFPDGYLTSWRSATWLSPLHISC